MTESVWLALIALAGTSLASTVSSVLAYLKSRDNQKQIHQLSLNVDGRLSQLLATTEARAHAEGVIQGGVDDRGPGQERAMAIIATARREALRTLETARLLAQDHLNSAHLERVENTLAVDANTQAVDANTQAIESTEPEPEPEPVPAAPTSHQPAGSPGPRGPDSDRRARGSPSEPEKHP